MKIEIFHFTDGSRAALALSWSYNGSRNLDARRQEAIRNVIEKSAASKPASRAEVLSNMHGCPSTEACQRSDHKNFVVTNRGFPIHPDYNIMTRYVHTESKVLPYYFLL